MDGKYAFLVAASTDSLGIDGGAYDATFPVAPVLERIDGEDAQVQKLVRRKGAFSAAAIWNICETRAGNARVTLRAQRVQLALDEAKANAVAQNKMSRQSKNLESAQQALKKYQSWGNSALTDKDWGDIVKGARLDEGFEKEGGHHRETGNSGKGLDYLYSSPCYVQCGRGGRV